MNETLVKKADHKTSLAGHGSVNRVTRTEPQILRFMHSAPTRMIACKNWLFATWLYK